MIPEISDVRARMERKIVNAVKEFDKVYESITYKVVLDSQDALNDMLLRTTINPYKGRTEK